MSSPVLVSVVAFLISAMFIVLLGVRDPKRLRNLRNGSSPFSSGARRGLTALSLVPGVALACVGQWWAFLIWLGAVTAAGWITAQTLAIRR